MTEINVIEKATRELSPDEIEAYWLEFSRTSDVDEYHFANFIKIDKEIRTSESAKSRPEILALLVRQLIEYDCIVPIIKLTPVEGDYDVAVEKTIRLIHGGAAKAKKAKAKGTTEAKKMRKTEETKEVKKAKETITITTQVKRRSRFLTEDTMASKQFGQTSERQNIEVMGYYVDITPMRLDNTDAYWWRTSTIDKLMNGAYGESYMHGRLFVPMHLFDTGFNGTTVMFADENQIRAETNMLLDKLEMAEIAWQRGFTAAFVSGIDAGSDKPNARCKTSLGAFLRAKTRQIMNLGGGGVVDADAETDDEPKSAKATMTADNLLKETAIEFVKLISKTLLQTVGMKYNDSYMLDLSNPSVSALFSRYYMLRELPREKRAVADLIEKYITSTLDRHEAEIAHVLKRRAAIGALVEEARYKWMYIHKFGMAAFNALSFAPDTSILSVIGKAERAVVMSAYSKWIKYLDQTANNTCPHLEVDRAMRDDDTQGGALASYHHLKKYMPAAARKLSPLNVSENEFIKCENCGLDLICPHVRDLMEMNGDKSFDDMKKRAFIFKYAGDTALYEAYYCRICGEPISYSREMDGNVDFIEGNRVERHHSDDELRNFIWGIANSYVRGFVDFKGVVSVKYINRFISNITDTIYKFIWDLEKKLTKIKTTTLVELENKKKLFTAVYVLALVLKIIVENPGKMRFANRKGNDHGGFVKKPFKKLHDLAMSILIKTQNIAISNISGLTEAYLNVSFKKAYGNLMSILSKFRMENEVAHGIAEILFLDPTYHYTVMATLWKLLESKKKITPSAYVAEFKRAYLPKNVLRVDVGDIPKLGYTYEKIAKEDMFDLGTGPDQPLFDSNPVEFYNTYRKKSYQMAMDYIHSQIYREPMHDITMFTPEGTGRLEIKIKYTPRYEAYMKMCDNFLAGEHSMRNLLRSSVIRPKRPLPFATGDGYDWMTFNSPQLQMVSSTNALSLKYGTPFHEHKWNVYAGHYSKSGKKSKIENAGDALAKLTREATEGSFIIDSVICSKCGLTETEAIKKTKNPSALLEEHQMLVSFYNFYKNRCPKPNKQQAREGFALHDFSAETCKSCGYKAVFGTELQQTYFKKYVSKYDEALEESRRRNAEDAVSILIGTEFKLPGVAKMKVDGDAPMQFATKTIDLAKSLNLTKSQYNNFWLNLGLSERVEFETFVSDPKIREAADTARTRISKCKGYFHMLIVDCFTMINNKNIPAIAPEFSALIKSTRGAGTIKIITGMAGGFRDSLASISQFDVGDDAHVAMYAHQALSAALGALYAGARGFVEIVMRKILEAERALCKPKSKKEAELAAHQTAVARVEDADIIIDEYGMSRMDDDLVTGNVDKYSFEGMDYDGENEEYNT